MMLISIRQQFGLPGHIEFQTDMADLERLRQEYRPFNSVTNSMESSSEANLRAAIEAIEQVDSKRLKEILKEYGYENFKWRDW